MAPAHSQDRTDGRIDGAEELLALTEELIRSVLTARGHRPEPGTPLRLTSPAGTTLLVRPGRAGSRLEVEIRLTAAFSIPDIPRLYGFCNAWNHDRFWPSAYVEVGDRGTVGVRGASVTDLPYGVAPHQLARLLERALAAGDELARAAAGLGPSSSRQAR